MVPLFRFFENKSAPLLLIRTRRTRQELRDVLSEQSILSIIDSRTKMYRQPVSIMPYVAHTTLTILTVYQTIFLFRHGVQLRPIIGFSIAFMTCITLLNQHQPRELWAFCLALGYTIWNLLPGYFALFDLPSHSASMRDLRMREQPGKCIVCWDTRPLAELPCNHQSCKD